MKIPLVDLRANYLSMQGEINVAIAEVLNKSAFIGGDILERFETNFAEWCEVKHAIGCSNGTSALHLALMALGLNNGAEVITVPNTFIATTEAISHVNGKIKFVDVEPDTALMNIDLLEKAISPRTKAILVVHLFGQMPDMKRLRNIADDKGLFLIEDAAQAHGAQWLGHQPGYYGDIATYSFFPAKILGCFGDGGCVTTNNDTYAERVRLLANHGRKTKYEHYVEGYNYRLDTLQAAILNAKLPKLRTKITKRQLNALYYDNYINDKIREGAGSSATYYMYVMRTQNRQEFIEHMRKKSIGTGIHYPIPLHLQHAYKGLKKGDFPVAEMLAEEIVSIPVYPELKPEQLSYIVRAVNDF